MACEQCGCRIPARLHPRSAVLVCADCGTPLPPVSASDRRNGWLGFAAITGAALVTTTLVIASGLNLESPTLADRQEPAGFSGGRAVE